MLNLADQVYPTNSREFSMLAALLRGGKLALPSLSIESKRIMVNNPAPGPNLATSLQSQASLEQLGFVYSHAALMHLSHLSVQAIHFVHQNVETMLTRALGAHQLFQPMYPNFPRQVLSASDTELLLNAWMHYLGDWCGVRVLPLYAQNPRMQLKMLEQVKPTVLDVAAGSAVYDQFKRLLNSNASLSESNKFQLLDLLAYFQLYYPGRLLDALLSATIPQKEIRALVGGWILKEQSVETFQSVQFERLFQTPTDILRLTVAVSAFELSAADLTLSTRAHVGPISRPVRMFLLRLLNGLTADSVRSEMFSRREQWLRVGESLHPGEHRAWFKRAHKHFKALRNNEAPASFAGTVEQHLAATNTLAAVTELVKRPGVFARKLHVVLRNASDTDRATAVKAFEQVAHAVSTPVLIQLRQRMMTELQGLDVQAFAPKAGAGRLWVPTTPPKRISPVGASAQAVVSCINATLRDRFAKLPAMGKVYIDPALHGFTVPFAQRTAQKALLTVGRGSRIALGNEPIIRAFLWWNESGIDVAGNRYSIGRTDLDLSAMTLDANFAYQTHCSFTRLRTQGLTHSGDITSAPNGACEVIDIDFDSLPDNAAYIGLMAYAYTNQNFADMPEAYLGWMARADDQSGDIYEARTVHQKVDLTTSGQMILVGFIDVAQREFVWADTVLKATTNGCNAIEATTIMTGKLAPGFVTPIRASIGELVTAHAQARGTIVDSADEADVVFSSKLPTAISPTKAGQVVITAYDAEVIVSDFLQ